MTAAATSMTLGEIVGIHQTGHRSLKQNGWCHQPQQQRVRSGGLMLLLLLLLLLMMMMMMGPEVAVHQMG